MLPFNYHHLYYFYLLSKEKNFSRAAKLLRISQPALSAQFKQFESYWGFKLIERNGWNLSLTEEGQTLFTYAKSIFDLGEEAADLLTNKKVHEVQKLQMGISVAVPRAIVSALIRFIYQTAPDIELVMKQDRIDVMIEELMTHKLDILINDYSYPALLDEGIENHLIVKIPMVFCANRKLAKTIRSIPKDLNDAKLILPTAPDQTFHAMQNFIHSNHINPKIVALIQDLEMVRLLVVMGKGVGLLNLYSVKNCPEKTKLTILKNRSKQKIYDNIYAIKRQRKIPHPVVSEIISRFRLKY